MTDDRGLRWHIHERKHIRQEPSKEKAMTVATGWATDGQKLWQGSTAHASLAGPHFAPGHGSAAQGEAASDWISEHIAGPMLPGSILVHAPSFALQAPGGGENQLLQTSRYLEGLGHTIRPLVSWVDRLEDARLLHLYGMSREGLELARVAKAQDVPVVLSPICWYEPRAILAMSEGVTRKAITLGKWAASCAWPTRPGWRRELLGLADAILPNSRAEAAQLQQLWDADLARIRVIPNGADARFAVADPRDFHETVGAEPFVLYVGRIEPRKNLLGLVRAVKAAGLSLVCIGDPVPGFESYASRCQREGQAHCRWLPRLDHADPLLASAYAAARVFALPSWFETPGLAALEAALAGAAVAITPNGCTREYFGDCVEYAAPDEPDSIAGALRRAWRSGPHAGLKEHIQRHYLWETVAEQTAEVYDQVAG